MSAFPKLALSSLLVSSPMVSALAAGLELKYSVKLATQGIFIDNSTQRKFLTQRYSTTLPPLVVELFDENTTLLYPNAAWNSYNSSNSSSSPQTTFVSIDGARLGPDGRLWLVDGGSTGVTNSSKLVGINITSNSVDKIYYLGEYIASTSVIDDVRFSASQEVKYMSDTAGALLIMNMTTGVGVRVLANDSSAQAWFPMMCNHTLVPGYGAAGSTLAVGLDQIEVSPDGEYLYYQPCNGGLWKVKTTYVDACLTNATMAATLGDYVEAVALTPSTGGSTIYANGNIYVSDTNMIAIWKITLGGYATILVQDDNLVWTDLVWITDGNLLWLPASQMRPGGNGLMAEGPNNIYTFPIDAGPSPIDHA